MVEGSNLTNIQWMERIFFIHFFIHFFYSQIKTRLFHSIQLVNVYKKKIKRRLIWDEKD